MSGDERELVDREYIGGPYHGQVRKVQRRFNRTQVPLMRMARGGQVFEERFAYALAPDGKFYPTHIGRRKKLVTPAVESAKDGKPGLE